MLATSTKLDPPRPQDRITPNVMTGGNQLPETSGPEGIEVEGEGGGEKVKDEKKQAQAGKYFNRPILKFNILWPPVLRN
jgi:hypothetical protein